MDIDRFDYIRPPPNIPPALEPLKPDRSEVVTDVEAAMQQAIANVFQSAIRPRLQNVMAYGMPHQLDDVTALERFVKAEGLALDRRAGRDEYLRELFRAWRARNPRRGLAFLRLYLRMMYPGASTVTQLWHRTGDPYPGGCTVTPKAGSYLTSRVRIVLSTSIAYTPGEVGRIRAVALSIIPARMVLELVAQGAELGADISIAAAADSLQVLRIGGIAYNP